MLVSNTIELYHMQLNCIVLYCMLTVVLVLINDQSVIRNVFLTDCKLQINQSTSNSSMGQNDAKDIEYSRVWIVVSKSFCPIMCDAVWH